MDMTVSDIVSVVTLVYSVIVMLYIVRKLNKHSSELDNEVVVDDDLVYGVVKREITMQVGKVYEAMDELGKHLKRSFTAIINSRQGALGEMTALFALKESYIRLIPLGKPIDAIGISDSSIDFLEVKTGKARLTKEERLIKDLVDRKQVKFRLLREDTIREEIAKRKKKNGAQN